METEVHDGGYVEEHQAGGGGVLEGAEGRCHGVQEGKVDAVCAKADNIVH